MCPRGGPVHPGCTQPHTSRPRAQVWDTMAAAQSGSILLAAQVLEGVFIFISQILFVSMDCIRIKAPRVRVMLGVNIMLALLGGGLHERAATGCCCATACRLGTARRPGLLYIEYLHSKGAARLPLRSQWPHTVLGSPCQGHSWCTLPHVGSTGSSVVRNTTSRSRASRCGRARWARSFRR